MDQAVCLRKGFMAFTSSWIIQDKAMVRQIDNLEPKIPLFGAKKYPTELKASFFTDKCFETRR